MAPLTCLTGSYPPHHDITLLSSDLPCDSREEIILSATRRAVNDQIEAGIDVLVDGQIRDDIVALFLPKLECCVVRGASYVITKPIHPSRSPFTVDDFKYARSQAPDRPFKAHVTGPISLAREATVETDKYKDNDDPNLVLDLAHALAQEAQYLLDAGAVILQIDEPALAHGVDLELASRAWRVIAEESGVSDTWLHACGDVRGIFDSLMEEAPIQALSVEGAWLEKPELRHVDGKYLKTHGKRICYGCIRVDRPEIELLGVLQRELRRITDRFGEENIAAITPNCGFRSMPLAAARSKMRRMVEAVKSMG